MTLARPEIVRRSLSDRPLLLRIHLHPLFDHYYLTADQKMSYYSLAPMIKQSKGIFKWLKPIADSYAKVVGHRKYGLRYDDLCECQSHLERAL